MATTSVGLVIRPQAVEVVELHKSFGPVKLVKYARVPIIGPEDVQVVAAIQAAFANAKIKPVRVGVAAPAQDVLLRSFVMPLLPKAEWASAVQFEARKYIPFKTEQLVWDFHVVEQRAVKQMLVTYVGIRTDTFARLQGWLKAAGVPVAHIEAPWVSLARLAGSSSRKGKSAQEPFLGVVDVESQAAHLAIIKDEIPYLARDVNLIGVTDEASMSAGAVDQRAERLLSDLRLSMDFFGCEHPAASISEIQLFGSQETIGAWPAWLSSQLSCPVTPGKLPMSSALESEYACAIGLALRQLQPARLKTDFLKPTTSAKIKSAAAPMPSIGRPSPELVREMARPVGIQVAVAIAGLLVLAFIGQQRVTASRAQLERTIAGFADVGWDLRRQPRDALQPLHERAEQTARFLLRTMDERVSVTEKLDALAKSLPEGVWLEGLQYDSALDQQGRPAYALVLRGACFLPQPGDELTTISGFVERIKQDPKFFRGFAAAQLGEILQAKDDSAQHRYRTFQLNCQPQRPL